MELVYDCKCRSCGDKTRKEGSNFICRSCGSIWPIITEDSLRVKLENAWDALRTGDFDKSSIMFDDIIYDEKQNFEAHWGKALAENGIQFVTDLNEHKKVPTCNNITESSFLTNKDVKEAISLAPKEISEDYKQRSEKIEEIRLEWLKKVSKEPPYDVFICFKDSDKENGIERTDDSIVAQDIYTYLVDKGYKVFYSRVSLSGILAEHYEPYVYNAIKTAKVMVVYGQKAEYFNSVWLRNEWKRFGKRIENGEKHKNSLVVAYENVDVSELPAALKSRQCINMAGTTAFVSLANHIDKIIEISQDGVHLDRIKIKGGKISKKAAHISVNSIEKREIGAGAIAEADISETQRLSLINTYLGMGDFKECEKLIEDVLFDNPGCAQAIWYSILAKNNVKNENYLVSLLTSENVDFKGVELLDSLLNCSSQNFAKHILDLLYSVKIGSDELQSVIFKTILPYSYADRDSNIKKAFQNVIAKRHFKTFDVLLTTLNPDEVDRYIEYNFTFVKYLNDDNLKIKYLDDILSVDEGNIEALKLKLSIDLTRDTDVDVLIKDLENVLKYSTSPGHEVVGMINSYAISAHPWMSSNILFLKQLLRYYTGELKDIIPKLISIAQRLLEAGYPSDAEYYFNLIRSADPNCADAIWGLCLVKVGAKNEADIQNRPTLIKSFSEFNTYLALVDQARQMECIRIAQNQEDRLKLKQKNKEDLLKDKISKKEASIQEYLRQEKNGKTINSSSRTEYKKKTLWSKIQVFTLITLVTLLVTFVSYVINTKGTSALGAVSFMWILFIIGFIFCWVISIPGVYGMCNENIFLTVVCTLLWLIAIFCPLIYWIKTSLKYNDQKNGMKKAVSSVKKKRKAEEAELKALKKEMEKMLKA